MHQVLVILVDLALEVEEVLHREQVVQEIHLLLVLLKDKTVEMALVELMVAVVVGDIQEQEIHNHQHLDLKMVELGRQIV